MVNLKSSGSLSIAPPVLDLDKVTVQRGDITLCTAVNLSLASGDICHLIGANGTGKTTLLMQLAGLLPLLKGEVSYCGQVGLPIAPLYVSHQLGINPNLTVAQNLTFLLNLYGIAPTTEALAHALDWVDLSGFEAVSSYQLSAGQTRRVTLARLALMTPMQAGLWLLDEPFTALDMSMVAKLQQRIEQFAALGGSVLMTSHQAVAIATTQLNLSDYLADDGYADGDCDSDSDSDSDCDSHSERYGDVDEYQTDNAKAPL